MTVRVVTFAAALLCTAAFAITEATEAGTEPPVVGAAVAVSNGPAMAVLDLATASGTAEAQCVWRYADAAIIPVDFAGPGADNKPTGAPWRTWDITPHAGAADFDDSTWEVLD